MPRETPVAWVTGAAGGIGRATVARLRREGFLVLASDLPATLPQDGGEEGVVWHACDATDEAEVSAAVGACLGHYPRLDAVIHLAGTVGAGPLAETSLSEWRTVVDANLTSAFLVARAAHGALRAARAGSLVLMSSTNALNGGSALSGPAYAAAKAGVLNLTRYLAREWAPDGIRVNCLAPGPVDTPMLRRLEARTLDALKAKVPLGRLVAAEEVADAIAYLCSKGARCLTGTVHNLSGGLVLD